MSTNATIEELPVNDYALAQTGASMTVEAKIQAAKAKAKAAREAAETADKEAASFAKTRRDEMRKNDRRALLVGRALLARSVVDRTTWNDLWPDLLASLSEASDEDRALVGLPPLVVKKPVEPPAEALHDDADVSQGAEKKEDEKEADDKPDIE